MERFNPQEQKIMRNIGRATGLLVLVFVLGIVAVPFAFLHTSEIRSLWTGESAGDAQAQDVNIVKAEFWTAASLQDIADSAKKAEVTYGQDLIAHTSKYLGPRGSVLQISNGMNCQNCHLDAGTKVFGNNYGAVATTYPKFRARSGSIENIYKRVNDCFERSLNGQPLDTLGKEMGAIVAYIQYLGSNVKKGEKAAGSGFKDLKFLSRAADPALGKKVYENQCQSCHQANGEGTLMADGSEYTYPPLWGPHSYNDAAGLYRVSNFAKYAKYNMPFGANHENTLLSDEDAWDVAAFVNSQPHPHKDTPDDWPDVSKKPIDHPFGPYADALSEEQHKFGPWPVTK